MIGADGWKPVRGLRRISLGRTRVDRPARRLTAEQHAAVETVRNAGGGFTPVAAQGCDR